MDLENIKVIMVWPTLKNVDEVKSFMELASYYRGFTRNLFNIGYPITSLQRKGNNFEWTIECATSFDQLKQFLTNNLVLRIENIDK